MTMNSTPQYLQWLRLQGYSQETITGRSRFLRRLAAALGGGLDDATAADLLAWRAALTVTDRVVVRYVSYARSYYAWLADEAGYRQDNPAARIPVPRNGRLLPRPVSERDLFAAIAAAPELIRIWLVLMAFCGLRCKEIALLRRENILDTASPPVLIVAADATKGRTERVIPLCSFVVGELRAAGLPPWGFAWGRADGRPGPNTPSRISQRIGDHLRGLGIPASAHMFRHRFATKTWQATRNMRLLQDLLGHSSPVTTAGYTLYASEDAMAAVEALPVAA